jgi:hypothetical protein
LYLISAGTDRPSAYSNIMMIYRLYAGRRTS